MSCCHPPKNVSNGQCSISSPESFEHPPNLKLNLKWSEMECTGYTGSVVVRCVFVLSCKCPKFGRYSSVRCSLCPVSICYSCASSVHWSVCVHSVSYGWSTRFMFVPCSWQPAHFRCKYVPVCSPSPKFNGLVILPQDTICVYSAMYVDPVWLCVTGPMNNTQILHGWRENMAQYFPGTLKTSLLGEPW